MDTLTLVRQGLLKTCHDKNIRQIVWSSMYHLLFNIKKNCKAAFHLVVPKMTPYNISLWTCNSIPFKCSFQTFCVVSLTWGSPRICTQNKRSFHQKITQYFNVLLKDNILHLGYFYENVIGVIVKSFKFNLWPNFFKTYSFFM